jgi:periplasmic divalent cation tolerance protein
MSPTRIVLCSVGNGEEAERIATALVQRRLAACVNLVSGVLSIYRWKGAVERDDERLLVIKTSAARFEELRATIVELHPYELPEVVALDVVAGHVPYLEWVAESCTPEAVG